MMDIDTMPAGAEMNVRVAKAIFGCEGYIRGMGWNEDGGPYWTFCGCEEHDHDDWDSHHGTMRSWSEDIAAAWEVVEKLVDEGYCVGLLHDDNGHWALSLDGLQNLPLFDYPEDVATAFFVSAEDWADTPELAICRAVYKVLAA